MTLHPPIPVADDNSRPFWEGLKQGKLLVQRCGSCANLQYPPDSTCEHCASKDLTFEEMSGKGRVFSFSETVSGARHPYFQSISPYLVGMVELAEQEGLVFASNFPGARYDQMAIGAPVEVVFQTIAEDVVIPQFKLADNQVAGN